MKLGIRGRGGLSLRDKWAEGPRTYLGPATVGFANFFMITGPGSTSVLSNMLMPIEQHVDWMVECIAMMRERGLGSLEPSMAAEDAWGQSVHEVDHATRYPHVASWYTGTNIPGKRCQFSPYADGVGTYRRACEDLVARDYAGVGFQRHT